MAVSVPGIHHVTAITADAQQNIDFYTGVLGLRLVKLTVNFDDPRSYHLYYGGESGRPGTILTFFAWPGAQRGRIGPPQVTATAFAVPADAIEYWAERLGEQRVNSLTRSVRFGEPVLSFEDPDAMQLEIVGVASPGGHAWTGGPVPERYSIRGFHGVTISEEGYEKSAELLTGAMGFSQEANDQNRFRYRAAGTADVGAVVDLLCVPSARSGTLGAGVVHHVAFRTPGDSQQSAWRQDLVTRGLNVSPIMERVYFKSIYFREPGGVLFEIATDAPGFTHDESVEQLGTRLMLPPWLESHRVEIERVVPPVRLPSR